MYDTYKQWFDEDENFTSKKDIEKVATGMRDNQFDPQGMIDKMVEVIPMKEHPFRTVFPEEIIPMCSEYEDRQYEILTDKMDKSKK